MVVLDGPQILSASFTCEIARYLGAGHIQRLERSRYVIGMRMGYHIRIINGSPPWIQTIPTAIDFDQDAVSETYQSAHNPHGIRRLASRDRPMGI